MKKLLVIIWTTLILISAVGCDVSFLQCEHAWVSATCSSPKRCSKCGETSGDISDHSTKLGTCAKCGEYINDYRNTLSSIRSNLTESIKEFNNAGKTIIYNQYSLSASVIEESMGEINNSKNYLNTAINSCAYIEELSTLKAYLTDMKDALDNITGSTISEYLNNYSTYGETYQQIGKQAADLLSGWM